MIRVGTAGWAIPRAAKDAFPQDGMLLQRYAARFNCAEINSTFYRSHRRDTYARWSATVPDDFRFAVKVPKSITHERQLADVEALLAAFIAEIAPLGSKLGPLLVQLPGSFAFEAGVARHFLSLLRDLTAHTIVCEPRHASWFDEEATALLLAFEVARVAADPARVPAAAGPGAWREVSYFRLHGSPRMYFSPYDDAYLDALAARLSGSHGESWCIFDNTGSGAAAANALSLADRVATE